MSNCLSMDTASHGNIYMPKGKRLQLEKARTKKAKRQKKEAKMIRQIAKLQWKIKKSSQKKKTSRSSTVKIVIAEEPVDRNKTITQSIVTILNEVAKQSEENRQGDLVWMKYRADFDSYCQLYDLYVQYSKHHGPTSEIPTKYVPEKL